MSSKLKLAQLFSAGLEDDTQDVLEIGGPEVVEEVISQVTDAETAAEEEVAEVTEEVSETVEQQEDLEEVAEALEAFANFLDHAGAKGGLGKTAAYAVGMGIEGHLDRVGMSLSDVMPGIESFGNEADKSESTKSFGEKVRGVIAKIWEAVVKFTNDIISKIADLYQRLKNWSPLMQRKAAVMLKAIAGLKDDPAGKDVKLSGTLAKKLYMGADGNVNLVQAGKMVVGTLNGMVATGDADKVFVKSEMVSDEQAQQLIVGLMGAQAVTGTVKVPEGYVVLRQSMEMPGGKVIALTAKQKDGNVEWKSATASVRDAHDIGDKLKDGVTIKCPSKAELGSIAKNVGDLAKATDKMVAARRNTLNAVKAAADKAASNSAKAVSEAGDDKAAKEAATELAAMARVVTKVNAQIIDGTVKIAMGGAGKGLLEAVAQCVKAAGGEAPAEEGKKEDGKKEEAKA